MTFARNGGRRLFLGSFHGLLNSSQTGRINEELRLGVRVAVTPDFDEYAHKL